MGACSLSPYFFNAPNKPKDLSKNQMCFENIFWLKKFFRTKGLTEDACWYNSGSERLYWVLKFIEGRSDVTQAAGYPVARAGMQMF